MAASETTEAEVEADGSSSVIVVATDASEDTDTEGRFSKMVVAVTWSPMTEEIGDEIVEVAEVDPVVEKALAMPVAVSSPSSQSSPSSSIELSLSLLLSSPSSQSSESPLVSVVVLFPTAPADVVVFPLPVVPPLTPAAENRLSASLCVSHDKLVPALFTSGSATHVVPEAHGLKTQVPKTHCANEEFTQA